MLKFLALPAALLALAGSAWAAPDEPAAAKTAPNDRGVMRYDTNKDGVVNRAEWKAGQEARFKRLDTNRDGKLTPEELFARTPAVGNSVLPSDQQVRRQSAFFQRMDTDKDGFVSFAEFMVQADHNFARCDVDNDGRIDTAECRQALQRSR